jgi:ATP adenylyltransferase
MCVTGQNGQADHRNPGLGLGVRDRRWDVGLDRLWAGWRSDYLQAVTGAPHAGTGAEECVFCRILASGEPDEETYVLWRGEHCLAILNAYPYGSGHLLVLPHRHVGELDDLTPEESAACWEAVRTAVVAVKAAYGPDGVNIGANLGRAAGAGVPGHLHLHVLPRWAGDSNFVTAVAEARVLPEALPTTYERLTAVWPR